MKHIFVSYSHKDSIFANKLIKKIEEAGFQVWIDHSQLHAGDEWRTKIDQAVKKSFVLIVIMTPEAKTSEYVTYEWAFASGAGIRIIPVILSQTKLPPRLETLQNLDFTQPSNQPWSKLIDEINTIVRLQTMRSRSTSRPQPSSPGTSSSVEAASSRNPSQVKHASSRTPSQVSDETISALSSALNDRYLESRLAAIEALGNTGNEKAAFALLPALKDHYLEARLAAVEALGKIGGDNAASVLSAALDDQYSEVRKLAVKALGKIGGANAVAALSLALNDSYAEIRDAATQALINIAVR